MIITGTINRVGNDENGNPRIKILTDDMKDVSLLMPREMIIELGKCIYDKIEITIKTHPH